VAKVIVKLKVMPESIDIDLNGVKKEIEKIKMEEVEIKGINVTPIAFGLKALSIIALMPDKEGICDKFVDEIKKINGVQTVEVEAMDLL